MDDGVLRVPDRLATTSVTWEGERARAWLARLPRLVGELAERWDLEVGAPFEPGGNISWVAPVRRRADGLAAVLKVQLPHPESAPEAAGLAAWGGRGAVLLHASDADRSALLIEWCRPGGPLVESPGPLEAARVGADLGARLHAVEPPRGLPLLADVLDRWAGEVEERAAAHAVTDGALTQRAIEVMRTRPRAVARPVLLHGDLNPTNVLAAQREPWLAIDPKPMVGDPAWDGPRVVLQPDPLETADPELTLRERLAVVVDRMALDRDALVDWCLVHAVEMGGAAHHHGDLADAARCAAHVELLRPHLA